MAVLGRSRRRRELEALLTDVWAEVMERPVAAGDDFFDLGGNSLHAVRIVGRLEGLLGSPVEVGSLLEARTPAAMAARLDELGLRGRRG